MPSNRRERRGLFSRWADGYDACVRASEAAGTFPFLGYSELLARVCDGAAAAPGTAVLELGCGTGNLTRLLRTAGATVTGVDWSARMLELAAQRGVAFRAVCADVRDRDATDRLGRFDRVVGCYALHEMPLEVGVALIVRLCRRHLQPGGWCVFGDLWFDDPSHRAAARKRWSDRWDDDEHYWCMSEALPALSEGGLAPTFLRVTPCTGVLRVDRGFRPVDVAPAGAAGPSGAPG